MSWNGRMFGSDTWERTCMSIIQVFWDRTFQVSSYPWDTCWNSMLLDGDTGIRDCMVTVEVSEDRTLHVIRGLHRRWSWNGHSIVRMKMRLLSHCLGLQGHRTLLVGICILRRCPEMAGHSVMWYCGRDFTQLLFRSSMTELFKSVEFFTGDSLKIVIHQWHRRKDFMVIFRSSEIFELV